MRKIVFATGNPNKVKEVNEVLPETLTIVGLKEIGCTEELPETNPTLEGNALQKARYVYENFGKDCFSEDTGLFVDALDGEPGVYTARYAGKNCTSDDNINLLLKNLDGNNQRTARFRTIIALILDGEEFLFEGIAEGNISFERQGEGGFGYDPVFIPEGLETSFAEMTAESKNEISHRAKAVKKLIAFFENQKA
ncbi:MAG: non-canonical purine NTP diphosphatase [Bacteroidetes bacterium]|nr:MAG: non-canonical purine NTP diphosphatase [Bacteroidota bacterium]